eukprot:7115228-Prymnesium_polylepis.1
MDHGRADALPQTARLQRSRRAEVVRLVARARVRLGGAPERAAAAAGVDARAQPSDDQRRGGVPGVPPAGVGARRPRADTHRRPHVWFSPRADGMAARTRGRRVCLVLARCHTDRGRWHAHRRRLPLDGRQGTALRRVHLDGPGAQRALLRPHPAAPRLGGRRKAHRCASQHGSADGRRRGQQLRQPRRQSLRERHSYCDRGQLTGPQAGRAKRHPPTFYPIARRTHEPARREARAPGRGPLGVLGSPGRDRETERDTGRRLVCVSGDGVEPVRRGARGLWTWHVIHGPMSPMN